MAPQYVLTPDYVDTAKTSGSQIVDSSYIASGGTRSRTGIVSGIALSAAIFISSWATPHTVRATWQPETVKKTASHGGGCYGVFGGIKIDEAMLTPTFLSSKLQKNFGFKTAQWAAVLNVERKTLYNWIKRPETSVHKRVTTRLNALNQFLQEIDPEHAQYVPKFAFGRYPDHRLVEALKQRPLDLDNLIENYERLYADFDGRYKRDKHKRARS